MFYQGNEQTGAGRYLKVKATKSEEKGGRKSERSILLMIQGNLPSGTLWRKGRAKSPNLGEKNVGNIGFESHLHGTPEGGRAGTESAGDGVDHLFSHHITLDLLKEAYRLTRKGGAVGVDGQTAKEYEGNLEENLSSLLERLKAGTYKAPCPART